MIISYRNAPRPCLFAIKQAFLRLPPFTQPSIRKGRNSLNVPIGLTVLTDTSYYISVMSKNSAYPASR